LGLGGGFDNPMGGWEGGGPRRKTKQTKKRTKRKIKESVSPNAKTIIGRDSYWASGGGVHAQGKK